MNLLFLGFVTLIIVQRLLELRIAKRNEKWALAHGAKEFAPEHYPWIVALHAGWILGIALEGYFRGAHPGRLWPLWLGVFLLAQAGRYWAISSLGGYWNTRILILPGGSRVRHGPYRYFKHPNYIFVALELFSGPLIFGATCTSVIAGVLNAALLLGVRIPAEERALEKYGTSLQISPEVRGNRTITREP
jgi:methyltransferase